MEVETPMLVSNAGGAAARPFETLPHGDKGSPLNPSCHCNPYMLDIIPST